MSLHYDESRPSPLQRQTAQTKKAFRSQFYPSPVARPFQFIKPPADFLPPSYWDIPSTWNMAIPELGGQRLANIADGLLDTIFTIRDIQEAVCKASRITRNDLLSARRTQNIVNPRQLAMALCRALTMRSMPEIGRNFNGKDHTTVLHAIGKMQPIVEEVSWSFRMQPLSRIVNLALDACWTRFPPAKYSRHGGRP